jgi:hypothetical protein
MRSTRERHTSAGGIWAFSSLESKTGHLSRPRAVREVTPSQGEPAYNVSARCRAG